MDKKKRTSKKQFSMYVNYLRSYDILRTGKLNPWDDPKKITQIWEKMTEELNSTGDGPTRSCHDWKKVFREWKSSVRKRARENKELTGVEKKFLELTGLQAVEGLELLETGLTGEASGAEAEELVVAAAESVPSENAAGETKKQSENEEIILIEVEDVASVPQEHKSKKKSHQNPLLVAYQNGQETERKGLAGIAEALDNVANSINRFCDIYERIHLK